jgi:hypothetical protein
MCDVWIKDYGSFQNAMDFEEKKQVSKLYSHISQKTLFEYKFNYITFLTCTHTVPNYKMFYPFSEGHVS